jgi:2-succinyl-6-hydroxy-2,4-cyclohexadiene-1-carboxylate synthase
VSTVERLRVGDWTLGASRWAGAGRGVMALHGFTGSGADFEPLAACLGRPLLAPDLPGHGATEGPSSFGLQDTLALLGGWLDAGGLTPPPVLLGYSLGARLALHLALARPERFAGLILIGATPGLEDATTRAERRASDEALADQIEAEGVAWFTDWWAARPVIESQSRIEVATRASMRARRLANRAQGLAASLRGLGTGALPARWADLPSVRLPTLLVTGAEDAKFGAIAAAMADRLPQAERLVVSEAGHCAHLERPAETAAGVKRFLLERGL